MATRTKAPRFEGPCATCAHKETCAPYTELEQHLFRHSKFQREPASNAIDASLDRVVESYLRSLRTLHQQGRFDSADLGYALAALVDFCITGVYTNGLVDDAGEFRQRALRCGADQALFPYTWMCPICVAAGRDRLDAYLPQSRRESKNGTVRDYPLFDRLAKPGGRAIGDQGIQVVKALLRATLKASGTDARLRDGGGERGEFDLTIATPDVLAFIEVKAKPLISYPLVARLVTSLPGTPVQHDWIELPLENVRSLSLFMAATDTSLPLSLPNPSSVDTWPLGDLQRLADDPATVNMIATNWKLHADAYKQWTGEPDALRWHRFGCGNFHAVEDGLSVEKRVANTKELPGLDRTDDIKKGAAQVLKYSRLKFQCNKRALRAVLLGNTHALTHHEDYVSPLLHLKVLDAGVSADRAEWIFDAMIGLTRDHFNAPDLAQIFSFEKLLED